MVQMGTLAVVAILLIAPMFRARLGVTDDHEIVTLGRQIASVGPLGTLYTHVAEPGRFRPLYWLGRIAETMAWGPNVAGWYLDRLALLLATLGAGYLFARRWFRPAIAVLIALLIVVGPQSEAFWRLGPQEAYAVPLTLAGLILVGRRRFGLGLGLLCLAALTKEPFVVVPLVGMAWAWRLGARRPVILAGIVAAGIALAIALTVLANGGDYYTAKGLTIPAEGRYLYPWVIGGALAVGLVVSRFRWAFIPVAALAGVLVLSSLSGARHWAASTRTFAAFVDELRGHPVVVVAPNPADAETRWALGVYLTGPTRGPCIEVDVRTPRTGVCPDAVATP